MWSLILRRLLVAIPTIFLVMVFVFILQRMLPGDPLLVMAGEERDPAVLEELRKLYGFDRSVPVQFLYWLREIASGNFGSSLRTGAPVTELIGQTLPVTIQLAVASLIIALLIGIPTGVLAAVKKGTWLDYVANAISLSGLSIPNFWLGIILILFVSVNLRWLPASGFVSIFENPVEAFRTTIMPAFVLGSGLAATLMRHTRSAMLEVLRLDYVRTARAKGLLEPAVVLKHALRNALVPIVTLSTLLFGQLLAGAVLTEQVFTIPGFGKLIVDAVFNRDYGVVQGVVLCTAIAFILMNLIADVLYIVINPRLRTA
ncbi:ABC transporter permease [Hyphomicrobium sp. CS1BSMeth3]|uniref:ABC transporter permease n=1 Tax=Hyphomicrobium sp. CS1BSMeth3 TaxID=1892844 RepID=UPI0009304CE0|nr:ABC transporter permease [Hyphomicrobium sp. CS1BSMeth3]